MEKFLKAKKKLEVIRNNFLIGTTAQNEQVVLPSSHYYIVYQELHEKNDTLRGRPRLLSRDGKVYWLSLERYIKDFVSTECQCISQKKPKHIPQAKVGLINSSTLMGIIPISFLKVDRCSGGYAYISIFVYHFLQCAQEYGTCNKFAEKLFNDFALQIETS